MKINDLKPAGGSTKRCKRVGRGPGSGHGKTSCKGHKGQQARSGSGKGAGFEGGQMPLQRRLPKRGFNNFLFTRDYTILNLDDLDSIADLSEFTPQSLLESGIINKLRFGVKILGDGEIKRAIKIKANAFSKSAIAKITAAGGSCEVV